MARQFLTRGQAQNHSVKALSHQIIIQARLVFEVNFGLPARHLIERRLRDIEVSAFNDFGHLAEEEREQKRPNVRAVNVRVGHDDDLVVAQLVDVELVTADPGAQSGDQRADFLAAEHPVETRAFHVQDFTTQGQNRLIAPRATLFGGPASAVTLDQENLRVRRIFFLTIGQFTRQRSHIHRGFTACQFTGFARRFTGQSGFNDLGNDRFGLIRVLFEPLRQLFIHEAFDRRTHLGRDQLVLGLARKFRIRHFDRQHTGQPLTCVVPGEIHLLTLGDPGGLRIGVDGPCQCAAQTRKVGAAIALRNVVGEGQNRLMVAVVPPHRDLNPDVVLFPGDKDRVRHAAGF